MSERDARPRLVLIHGWAQHAGVWQQWEERLSAIADIESVDLPGHGGTRWDPAIRNLDQLADSVLPALEHRAAVCGWSLGGMVALNLAMRYPARVDRLILCNTTPRFLNGDSWTHGVDPSLHAGFRRRIADDPGGVLRDFLSLQLRGEKDSRQTLGLLRGALSDTLRPGRDTLQVTLDLLGLTDLRDALPDIGQPALIVASDADAVTPAAAAGYLARYLPAACSITLRGCGHAGPLARPHRLSGTLEDFLHGEPSRELAS